MIDQDLINDPDQELKHWYSQVVILISELKMFNLLTVLIILPLVGLPQSFDPQPQTTQQGDSQEMQSFESREFLVSLNSDQIEIANHNYDDENTEDIAPKRGDGRREN
ncbi:MAG: hypothetical protein AUK43_20540 [Oscillatoriales cyanobacterium CG2_30_40_61]|nr:MAG: hypothetical protein AUK43_20540 [Oscillatoriales cyanobacterium CG2_30_40_61]